MKINKFIDGQNGELLEIITDNSESWISIIGKKNRFLWANKKFLKVLNKSLKQLADSSVDALPFIKKSHIDKKIKICAAGKKIIEDADITVNKKKYQVRLKLFPLACIKPEDHHVLMIMEDISYYFDLTREITRTNRFVENIFNNVRVYSIITTDKNFLVQRFNKGAELLFEYADEEVENKFNIRNFFSRQSIDNFNEIVDVLKKLNLVRREVEMQSKVKHPIMVDLAVSKILDEHKRVSGYIFIASDITEHKKLKQSIEKQNMDLVRLYQDMQKANKAKSFFLANMSHELRTPLTAILGFSELMMDNKVGMLTAQQKEFVNDIYTSGKHLLTLINDVLDLSKIEAERLELNIEKVCLNDIINSAKMFILPDAKRKNLQLIDDIPEKRIWIKADESRLKQALYNLYSNASKFTPDNGRITTNVHVNRTMVDVAIADTGIGIKSEDQDIIFEEFLQIENPYSKKYTGTGLGLALVRKFMEMMDGGVAVFSDGEGKGACFTVSIPVNE